MSKVRIYGDTSGYVDIAVPAVAGTTTLNLDKIPQADISGNIAMDTDTLFVDAANNRVGIGTTSPSDDLEINPSADEKGITLKTTSSIRPYLNFDANRSGANQQVGRIQGKWNGTTITRIEMVGGSDTTNKDDGYITFQTASSASDLNERIRITSSGNVGIGTNNPSQKLHVSSADHTRVLITGGTDKYAELQFENDAQKFAMGVQNDNKFFLYNSTGTATVLTVDTSNRVGIGTQSPTHMLEIKSSGNAGQDFIKVLDSDNNQQFRVYSDSSTGEPVLRLYDTSGSAKIVLHANGSSRFEGGNVGFGTSSPSAPIDVVTNSNVYAAEFTQSNTSNGDGMLIQVGSTASADYALTVRSDAGNTSVLAAKADGKVGIGTFTPSYKLHSETSSGTDYAGYFRNTSGSGNSTSLIARGGANNTSANFQVQDYNGNADFTVTGIGNVEIGSPLATHVGTSQLFINRGVNSLPATSGTTQTGGALRLRGADNAVLDMGMNSINTWIQATDRANLANGYPLLLNPNGGNVGIGTTSPDSLLHLQKTRGTISGGSSDTGAVIKLHTEAQWESGYGNNALATTNDYLGSIEFSTGDSSTGEGVRAAIRGTVDSYYNQNSIVFETATGATAVAPTERMRVWHNGIVTKPYTPSFSCYKNGNQTEQTGNVNVTGWSENFDQGNCVNNTSGIFTAPVAGKYYFTFNAMHSGTMAGDAQYKIYHNGVYYQGSNDTSDGSSWDQCTVVAIIDMAENDTANPVAYSSQTNSSKAAVYTNRYSGWMGFLIG